MMTRSVVHFGGVLFTWVILSGPLKAEPLPPDLRDLTAAMTRCIKTGDCANFDSMRQSLGLKKGANDLPIGSIYYFQDSEEKFLGKIRERKIRDGINIFFCEELAYSSSIFTFVYRLEYASGKIDIVIGNLLHAEKSGRDAARNWGKYKANHARANRGEKYDAEMEAVYGAISELKTTRISEAYVQLSLRCSEAHEMVDHSYWDITGEVRARRAELRASRFAMRQLLIHKKYRGGEKRLKYHREVAEVVWNELITKAGSEKRLLAMSSSQLRRLLPPE